MAIQVIAIETGIRPTAENIAASGRRERNAPEIERLTSISEAGTPIGLVEIWIPLEPLSRD